MTDIEQRISQWEQKMADQVQRYQRLQDQVDRLSITERSRDGSVQVTVSANGLLADLVLADGGKPMNEVAAQIMSCMRRAQARIPDLFQQAVTETVGAPDEATQLMVAEARQRFPEPAPEPRSDWQPAERRLGRPDEDAGEWSFTRQRTW